MAVHGRNPLWIFLIAYYGYVVNAEVFTAMADMENLLYTEKHVVSVIDRYIEVEMERLERLKEFAKDYQSKNQGALTQGVDYISNPVNAYLLIKRLTSDWSYVESMMRNNMAEDYLKNITSQRDSASVRFPEQEDLDGAAIALMRLQDTYRLSTQDMAEGRIQGVQRTGPLDAHDCFEIGRIAYNQQDYYHTLLWMEEAMSRMHREEKPTVIEQDVLEYLAFSMYQQGNIKRALKLTKRLYRLQPDHPRAKGNIKYYEDMLVEAGQKKGDDGDLPPVVNERNPENWSKERETYEALCRGEKLKTDLELSKLYCHYKSDSPYLRVAPIKVEILHWKPKIMLLRQVVSDSEIEIIKELASPRLERAEVIDPRNGDIIVVRNRISKSAWLKGEHHPAIERINKRLQDMTGLTMETAEDLQIANYGLGGHYEPHFDMSTRGETDPYSDGTGNRIATVLSYRDEKNAFQDNTGNRIATALFYLSTPEAGGATVFPELKLTLWPSKNDAVFWFNLYKSGEGDMTTRHAACPVLAGVKWVSNKWIHERGQEFRRPCARDEFAYE